MDAGSVTIAVIETPRLILRKWRDEDRAPFAAINADPRVMGFLPRPLDRRISDEVLDTLKAHFKAHSFGLWALELRSSGEMIGFTGLKLISFAAPFAPGVEIGWRLAFPHWGKGFATEAARASLDFAFQRLNRAEIFAITPTRNLRSRHLMERLGMTRDPADDFNHPKMPPDHSLQPCVLYRITAHTFYAKGHRS